MKTSRKIKNILSKMPNSSGIYLFYNFKKELIYVGKATSLKNRVKSYFSGLKSPRPIEFMIHEVADIKYKPTDSVLEAVILEANHIKKLQPKYNIEGKDNKSWNYLVLTKEDFPKLLAVRQYELERQNYENTKLRNYENTKIKAKYSHIFGPFPGLNTKEALKLFHKIFYISRCNTRQKRPCFDYQLGFCLGVCTGEITKEQYKQKVIKPLISFLKGNKKRLISSLKKEMQEEAQARNFEEAARLKKQINSLERIYDVALLNKSLFEDSVLGGNIKRIEGYDISNLGETGKVGSMVVFNLSGPIKQDYKRFKIKTVIGQSDIACLEEVLYRRLKHDEWMVPDLILVDGGKGQVRAVRKVIDFYKKNIPILGLAKGKTRKKNEFIFDKKNKYLKEFIEKNQDLLIQVRDEAHRFAIAYQRKLRRIKK